MSRQIRADDRRDGFTIIELLVVVTIIGVMTMIIAPTFRISEERRVENMAHLLVAHLEMARTQALGNRQVVRVQFDEAAGTYVAYADHDGDGNVTGIAAETAAFPEFGSRQLDDLLIFGRGTAPVVAGDAGTEPITLTSDRFTMDNQAIPTPWGSMGTIYITHSRDNTAVAAISVASSGSFKAWRWMPALNQWQ
jgi:prepilin-type N-terminal cleavage/methylation domain-containing protein